MGRLEELWVEVLARWMAEGWLEGWLVLAGRGWGWLGGCPGGHRDTLGWWVAQLASDGSYSVGGGGGQGLWDEMG